MGLVLIIGVFWYLLRRQRNKKNRDGYQKQDLPSYSSSEVDRELLSRGSARPDGQAPEMSAAQATQELSGSRHLPKEMSTAHVAQELSGSRHLPKEMSADGKVAHSELPA